LCFFVSSRRRHTRSKRDWSSDVCSSDLQHVESEMKRLQQQGPPELSIGLIESAEFWMPKVLATFKAEFSDVHIRLLEVLSLQDVEKALTHFHVHLAITNQYINNKDMQTIPI